MGTLILSDTSQPSMSLLLVLNIDSSLQPLMLGNLWTIMRSSQALWEYTSSLTIESQMLFMADTLTCI